MPANDFRTMMWDLTSFPEWVCSLKAGNNAYQPLGKGSLTSDSALTAGLGARASRDVAMADAQDEELQLQMAIAASMAVTSGAVAPAPEKPGEDEMDEEERHMQEALALSLS